MSMRSAWIAKPQPYASADYRPWYAGISDHPNLSPIELNTAINNAGSPSILVSHICITKGQRILIGITQQPLWRKKRQILSLNHSTICPSFSAVSACLRMTHNEKTGWYQTHQLSNWWKKQKTIYLFLHRLLGFDSCRPYIFVSA